MFIMKYSRQSASKMALNILLIFSLFYSVSGLDSVSYTTIEERPAGTYIGNIKSDANLVGDLSATDYQRLTFSILTPVGGDTLSGNYFQVEESTGILRVLRPIDRDHLDICAFQENCEITFDVAVGPEDIFRVIAVKLTIVDINDNSPIFGLNEMNLNISELATAGSSYQLPVVSDLDGDEFGIKKVTASPSNGQFDVRWKRGSDGKVQPRLEVLTPVDREVLPRFDLSITATDGGSPPRTAMLLVHVEVLDANDNRPVFEQAGYEVSVSEHDNAGGILVTVRADDADHSRNGHVTYKMAANTIEQYGNLFLVAADTGIVTFTRVLDRETQDVYYLTVVAVDGGVIFREASATVTVYVEDVNDNPPVIRISTLTDSDLAQVSEGSELGTFVALISVKDQDLGRNADVTCTLNTADFRLDALQADKFKMVTDVVVDREKTDFYDIEVFCRDNGVPQLSSTANVRVQVGDVNDHAPVFESSDITMHVLENSRPGTVVGQVKATDADSGQNGRIVYSTTELYRTYVTINEETGVITTISSIDREAVDQFTIHIVARDRGNSSKSAIATVTIIVDDVNDMVPAFTQSSYTVVVAENLNSRHELARLIANDRDKAPFNKIQYSLRGQNAYFLEINADNGTLYSVKPLDREAMISIEVQAVATDVNNPEFVGFAKVTVYVGDANDNAPRIVFPTAQNSTIEISRQLNEHDTVGWIQATDGDSGQNAVLEYHLTFKRQSDIELFAIDSETGLISVLTDLSKVEQDVVPCMALVRDAGIPSLSATVNFNIIINSSIIIAEPSIEETRNMNITIVIIVISTTLVLAAILIGAILFVFRRMKRRRENSQPRYTIEKMGTIVPNNGQMDLEKQPNHYHKEMKQIIKVYDPKTSKELDRESLGSGEGSTTDSGRGASEEGEHGDHDRSVSSRHNDCAEPKQPTTSYLGAADDSIITGHLDLSTSFEQTSSLPRRGAKTKNVTFEEDVMVAEILEQPRYSTPQHVNNPYKYEQPMTELPHYGSYDGCTAMGYPYAVAWSPDAGTDCSATAQQNTGPRRTVRNVKAKDRSKRMDSLAAMHANVQSMQSEPDICQNYDSHRPYDFSDSNSLLKYKMLGTDDSTSEINSAASTTSGSYIIQSDDLQCECSHA